MYLAWRDLRFARGRFLLIGSVVTLITILVAFLSGLTAGLADQNISAVRSLPADRLVFSQPEGATASFADSTISTQDLDRWRNAPGVESAAPVGISQGRARGTAVTSVAFFGTEPGFSEHSPSRAGTVVLSTSAADELGASTGDQLTIADNKLTVSAVSGDDWYGHTPVVWMNLADWQETSPGADEATVLAVDGTPSGGDPAGTVSRGSLSSLSAIGSFTSEIGSLLMMVAMLFGISALVIGAFFTVWTLQRSGDIAVLKALGASTRSLLTDAIGQAALVLVAGIGLGITVTVVLGQLLGAALPFVTAWYTTALPALAMMLLGLAGAAVSVRSVTSSDPLTALGSNR